MEESLFEVRPSPGKGKGLFALKNFNEGDIVFKEVPLVSCQFAWNEDYGYSACEYCLRPLETALENAKRLSMNESLKIPYPEACIVNKESHVFCQTCGVQYCSTECQQMAWNKYHKTLCLRKMNRDKTHPLEFLKETWKEMHYPPETATVMLFAKIFAMIHQAENKELIINQFSQFCHNTVNEDEEIFHKLLGVKFSNQLDILRDALKNAVPTEDVPQWITPAGFQSLVALVGMNGQGIGTSSVGEWSKNIGSLTLHSDEKSVIDDFVTKLYEDFERAVGEFLNNEGTGLYAIQSSINHSCIPNAEVTFPNANFQLAIKALSDIEENDEICISYLDECLLERSRHTRQKILRTNYLFHCKCNKCEQQIEEPDVTSEDDDDDDDDDDDEDNGGGM